MKECFTFGEVYNSDGGYVESVDRNSVCDGYAAIVGMGQAKLEAGEWGAFTIRRWYVAEGLDPIWLF